MKNISLKFKLLFIFVGLSTSVLLSYAYLALSDFENDKIAYVFDSTLAQSKSISNLVRTDLEFYIDKIKFFSRGFDSKTMNFHSYTKSILPFEKNIEFLAIYTKSENEPQYIQKSIISKSNININQKLTSTINTLTTQAMLHRVSLQINPDNDNQWLLALRFGKPSRNHHIVVSLITKANFLESFTVAQIQDSYLTDSSGKIILEPKSKTYSDIETKTLKTAIKEIQQKIKAPTGINEFKNTYDKSGNLLISFSKIGTGGLFIFSAVPKSAALEAVKMLMIKSALFIFLIICITIFISVLAASQLTSSLKTLLSATKEISKGQFDVNVQIKSKDEIGLLSEGFNHMAKEINRLMGETKEKARMEGELKTAQLVQSTLFPVDSYDFKTVSIRGFYESASECGGDWWFHNQIDNKVYLWIGDATGHGVPAALVTSAARSAASVLNNFKNMSPKEVMEILNKAIYNTAGGKVLMTFFLASFDISTNELTYCTASHDPPFLFPKSETPLKKRDILPLMGTRGARLGETYDSEYQEDVVKLKSNDKIVFYTDGVTELYNNEHKMWGERKFIKCLLDSFNNNNDLDFAMDNLLKKMSEFRGETPLEDDVTYFMFQTK
ncbi:MAG: SpoIIE family protein phosphatase [Bdellovibrionaceae bacterium]|nr:SpoIIE family protein phosphatase [Pseudobdellovibrionaceae bacterium]